jgi:hypothetical protein
MARKPGKKNYSDLARGKDVTRPIFEDNPQSGNFAKHHSVTMAKPSGVGRTKRVKKVKVFTGKLSTPKRQMKKGK